MEEGSTAWVTIVGHAPERPTLPADPRTDQHARSRAARHGAADDRSSQRRVRGARPLGARGLERIFQTSPPVVIFPASGSGAWEAALVNTLSPGDRVLAFDIGEFSRGWAEVGRRLGLDVDVTPGDWRHGVDPAALEARLTEDRDHRLRAVLVVHNETSTGVTSRFRRFAARSIAPRHPGAAARRRGLVLGLDRSPPRRVGAGRHIVGLAERADAAARLELQRHQRKGACRVAVGAAAAVVFLVGSDAGPQRQRVLPIYTRDESAVRAARSPRHAGRGRAGERVRAASAAGGGGTRGRDGPGASRSPASARTSTVRWSRR